MSSVRLCVAMFLFWRLQRAHCVDAHENRRSSRTQKKLTNVAFLPAQAEAHAYWRGDTLFTKLNGKIREKIRDSPTTRGGDSRPPGAPEIIPGGGSGGLGGPPRMVGGSLIFSFFSLKFRKKGVPAPVRVSFRLCGKECYICELLLCS